MDYLSLILSVAIRTTVVLIALVVALRVVGKRHLSEMNVLDILLILIVANAVQNSMTKGDGRLGVAIGSAGALLGLGALMGILSSRRPEIETRLVGSPTVLVRNGMIVEDGMRQAGITHDELMARVRNNGLAEIKDVALVVLEMDGSISVVPKRDEDSADDRGDSRAG